MRNNILGEAQRIQHRKTARLDHQPRAYRAGLVKSFEQGDTVALAMKQKGGCQASRAASGDSNGEVGHFLVSCLVQRKLVGADGLEPPTLSV